VPELPEVETVRRGLNQVTLGQIIKGGEVLLPRTIAHPAAIESFLDGLQGTAIAAWHRHGKYLLAELVCPDPASSAVVRPGGWLGVHLRMTGQLLWLTSDQPLQKHTRVRVQFVGNQELRFVDQRTFGQMWWAAPEDSLAAVIPGLAALGPEPFSEAFSVDYLIEALHSRQRSIKSALLDQTLVAGVGNIYADEALFLSGILPQTACRALERGQLERLRTALLKVLEASIAEGGTTFSNFLNVQGVNGNYAGVAWVYNRTGEPCRVCTAPIQRIRIAGRSAHFCPSCQS